MLSSAQTLRTRCFNRYMVECELALPDILASSDTVLIDTWWNVNTCDGSVSLCPFEF